MIHHEASGLPTSPSSGRVIDTPTGRFYIGTDQLGRPRAGWLRLEPVLARYGRSKAAAWDDLASRLLAYFEGGPWSFDEVPTPDGSPFQMACWNALRSVPPGELVTYGRLAELAGSPGAARAVGSAMRNNPLPIIIPCHRVISAGGIGGFSGSTTRDGQAIPVKLMLIRLEKAFSSADQRLDEIEMPLA
ncbi:MAG: cysteine methyltransferase [Phycisphaerae bacterium]|nr:cysteine methyltransferase [Phycisphaerae bacterium]